MDQYLLLIYTPSKYGIALAKFLSSNHTTGIVEFEFHVLFHCPKYDDIRNLILINWYTSATKITNLYLLLYIDNPDVIKIQSYSIYMLMKN